MPGWGQSESQAAEWFFLAGGWEKPQKSLLHEAEWFSWGSLLGLRACLQWECSGAGLQVSQRCGGGASGASGDRGCSCPLSSKSLRRCHPPPGLSCWERRDASPGSGAGSRGCLPSLSLCPQPKPENAITIAVSSRALFRMEEEQKIYNEQGVEAYVKYQLDHENEPFLPGAAFPFVKALEAVNTQLRELYPDSEELFDIVLMTNNHAQVGVRLINSINHYDLFIERFCMTGGNSPICYLKAYHANLYLSSDAEKVSGAIEEGIAAATIFSPSRDLEVSENQLRVAFDGDAVLFSDESEQIVKAHGLDMFFEHEKAHENKPLAQGPLKGFLEALGKLQKKFYSKGLRMECPIRTYLVTARSAASSGARALKTLRSWGLETDEALFLAGAPKGPLLRKIRPHIFFDDQMFHVEGAKEMGTVAAHVPYGVAQKHKRPAQEKQTPNSK
ncbi:cytosolic 5'-nucleotidase 1A [Manacus vitellinus]|uniref:cytosolic 5'-nucleotidase 1A n=1 Tax=Manacus vitellinus TaxID=328815 RepID=UPI00115ED69B|nr:cytosolic 5'-nucleotidase 1A [Manacus vitellinus]